MIWQITLKEFKETFRDGRFVWVAGILGILLIASLIIGWSGYGEASAMREAAAAETRQQWLDQGVKNPHSAQHYGIYAFKPITPLSLFDPGVNNYTGTLTLLEAHKPNEFKYKVAQDATALQRFRRPLSRDDLAAVVSLADHPSSLWFACRGEGGRNAKQLLSTGVRKSTLCAGKVLGVTLTLGAILAPCALLSTSAIVAFAGQGGDVHSMEDIRTRVFALVLVYLLYFSCIAMLTLGVSALGRSSRVALTMMLAFWILTSLAIPRAASDLSRQIVETPSAFEYARAVSEGIAEGPNLANPAHPNYKKFVAELLAKYGVDSVEDLPLNFVGLALEVDEEYTGQVYDRLNNDLWDRFDQQNKFQQAMAIVSPYLALRSLSSSISGSDFEMHRAFTVAAEQYRRMLARTMNEDLQRGAAGESVFAAEWTYEAGPNLWAKVPPFDYDLPPMGNSLRKQSMAVAMLFCWSLISALFLWFAIRRMRIDG